jgi:hypothetical protein
MKGFFDQGQVWVTLDVVHMLERLVKAVQSQGCAEKVVKEIYVKILTYFFVVINVTL